MGYDCDVQIEETEGYMDWLAMEEYNAFLDGGVLAVTGETIDDMAEVMA